METRYYTKKGILIMAIPRERKRTYKIIKFEKDRYGFPVRSQRPVMKGLTLEEAQKHCQREDTHGKNWFHGYTEE